MVDLGWIAGSRGALNRSYRVERFISFIFILLLISENIACFAVEERVLHDNALGFAVFIDLIWRFFLEHFAELDFIESLPKVILSVELEVRALNQVLFDLLHAERLLNLSRVILIIYLLHRVFVYPVTRWDRYIGLLAA